MQRIVRWGLAAMLVGVFAAGRASAQPGPPVATDPTAAAAPSSPGTGATEGGVVKRLVRDVAGDYKNFFSVETGTWLGLGGAAALATHAADTSLYASANDADVTLPGGGTYGSQLLHVPVAAAWWAVAAAAGSARHAETGRDLLRAQVSVFSWTYANKIVTQRERPNGDPHSFPSGHASTSFATAMVLQEHYGWKVGLPAFAAASYAGASRVVDKQHWASDVVFGAALGMVSARTVTVRLRESRISLAPFAVADGGGVTISVTRPS